MGSISKRHHYIPQFFLNNFGIYQRENYMVNIFNKGTLKKYSNSVNNTAYIKDFHTVKLNGKDTDIFEKWHNEMYEKKFSRIYTNILGRLNNFLKELFCYNCLSDNYHNKCYLLDNDEKQFLSQLLAYFIIRGKKYRECGEAFYDKAEELYKMVCEANGITDKEKITKGLQEKLGQKSSVKLGQLKATFIDDDIEKFANMINSHIWNVCFNTSNTLFYANDTAHSLDTMWKDHPKARGIGYSTYGNYIIFPLTPRICIIMYDRRFVIENKLFVIDCNFVKSNKLMIDNINKQIVFSAVNEVYSQDNNWSFLDYLYKMYKIPKGDKPYSIG